MELYYGKKRAKKWDVYDLVLTETGWKVCDGTVSQKEKSSNEMDGFLPYGL